MSSMGPLAMMARSAEPCLCDGKGKNVIAPDARSLGNLHEGILGQRLQQSPTLGMSRPPVECTATHPEPLEGITHTSCVALCRAAEAPVGDVRGNGGGNKRPDIIPEHLAGSEEVGSSKPGGGLGIEAGMGLPGTLLSKPMFPGNCDEILPHGCEGRCRDGCAARRGKAHLIRKVIGAKAGPSRRSMLEEPANDDVAGRTGQSWKQKRHSGAPGSASARIVERKTPGRLSSTERMKEASLPGHALRSHVAA
jgi:hypothetical protein